MVVKILFFLLVASSSLRKYLIDVQGTFRLWRKERSAKVAFHYKYEVKFRKYEKIRKFRKLLENSKNLIISKEIEKFEKIELSKHLENSKNFGKFENLDEPLRSLRSL